MMVMMAMLVRVVMMMVLVMMMAMDENDGNDEVCYYTDVCGPMKYPNPNRHGDGH